MKENNRANEVERLHSLAPSEAQQKPAAFDPLTHLPGEYELGQLIRSAVEHDAEKVRFYLMDSIGALAQQIARLYREPSQQKDGWRPDWLCEFCLKPADGNLPDDWHLIYQSPVCPDCFKKVPQDGGFQEVKGLAYAYAKDPRPFNRPREQEQNEQERAE